MSSVSVVSTPTVVHVVSGAPKANFRSFNHEYEQLLNDDYLNKTLTVKYTGKGTNFQVAAKESFTYKTLTIEAKDKEPEKKVDTTVFDKEVKIITNIQGRNVETKFTPKLIRTWADLGVFNVGQDVNVTAKVKASNAFDQFNGWVNGEYKGKHCNANVRLELKKNNKPYLNTKVIMTEKDVRVGFIAKVGLNGFDIKRHNLFASYKINKDLDAYLGHYTLDGDVSKDIGTIVGAAVYQINKHSVVFQGQWQKSTKALGATFGVSSKIDDKTSVRAKVNHKGLFSLLAKRVHCKNLSILAGTELNVLNPGDSYKATRNLPVPLMLSLEFTYN